ncbi:MAG: hypothetical protein ACOC10_06775, partial [Bacteroidota bacterium]
MKYNILIVVLVFAIQFFSCEEETPNPQTAQNCFEVTDNFNESPNLESTWKFLGFVNKLTNESICAPENYTEVFMSITPYNEFNVNSSCNSVNGHYLTAEG